MVWWRIILLLIFAVTIPVHNQLDSHGFVSIDCGLSGYSSYVDRETNLTYVSDEQFIDTGVNSQVSSNLPDFLQSREFETVRSFPTGIRNCYTIRSLTIGFKYLIRATFYYGNYDKLSKPPTFDIYLGVDFWDTLNTDRYVTTEIIGAATANYMQVCLVNKNDGNPFISSLHLRQLNSRIYQYANESQSLILVERVNFGASKKFQILRYPYDKYDRWWQNNTWSGWKEISTNSTIQPDPDFETPSLVMQTAVTTSSTKEPLNLYANSDDNSTKYYFILQFNEIKTSLTGQREFNILVNGIQALNEPIILQNSYWYSQWISGSTDYNVSIVATSNSTLPPLINAAELYKIATVRVPTYGGDVAGINSVKKYYNITKGWNGGDPCLPTQFIWTGINCNTDSSNITRITGLNISSRFLTGLLSDSIGNLTSLEQLDLSSNDLSGALPISLNKLTALTYLDIRGNNKMSTTLPLVLQERQQNGSLTYWFGDIVRTPSPAPFPLPPSPKKYNINSIDVVIPLLVIAVVITTVFWLRRKLNKKSIVPKPNESFESSPAAAEDFLDNRQFSYNDLKRITNDFKNNIGKGGFGSVYLGLIEHGFQVAVKMRTNSSPQGVQELLAEAKNLGRVHHKNLVTLIGYCIDGNCMALVYEYMQEGNLQQKLKDDVRPLTWKLRLRIAYQSALGLEYLHKACNPPLIHRDVKSTNILLNANLQAKIADFGLCRTLDNDAISHVLTRIIGTPGYVDPEYYLSNKLSAKSDVFSFGVVLLEIITGRPPTSAGLEGGNLVQWVRLKLSAGDIESIVDPRMQDSYDINSVWKVTVLACKCTEFTSSERPTMAVVAAELKESLDLETSTEEMDNESTENLLTDVSKDKDFEIASLGGISTIGPTER